MLDRRRISRLPVVGSGIIEASENGEGVHCAIRNYSVYGAMLAVDDTVPIPDEFNLTIPQHQITLRARPRWRRHGQVGVEFLYAIDEAMRHKTDPAQQADYPAILEAENRLLKQALGELVLDVSILRRLLGATS